MRRAAPAGSHWPRGNWGVGVVSVVTAASLRINLSSILDDDSLGLDAERHHYAVDGLVPKAVAFPTTEDEVAAVLGLASREGLAVIPRGSGSLVALGGVPERVDVVLVLKKLSHHIEHAPGDLTVTVGVGTTLEHLQRQLAEEGQWLPLDPPLAPQRTVGGVLASNLAGPLSLAYGTARDLVIGMRVAGTDGVVTKSGGRVVKNVTGFDVTKTHLGALGTLGVILEASLKVEPLPKEDLTLVAQFGSQDDAFAACQDLVSHPSAPQAIELAVPGANLGVGDAHDAGPGCHVYARLLGPVSSMERRLEECRTRLREAGAANLDVVRGETASQVWRWLADFGWESLEEEPLLLRFGCLPSRTQRLATGVMDLARQQRYEMQLVAGPGRGAMRCLLPGNAWKDTEAGGTIVATLRELAESVDGYAVVERCPSSAKTHLDVWGDPGQGLALMRRLKEQMDPGRVLNPGRFVGGI